MPHLTRAAGTHQVCLIPNCECQDENADDSAVINSNNVTNDVLTSAPPVACYVDSVSEWDTTMSRLTPDVASLSLECANRKLKSYLTSSVFAALQGLRSLSLKSCKFASFTPDLFDNLRELR